MGRAVAGKNEAVGSGGARCWPALLAEGSLPPGAAVPVWVGLDTGGERTYNAE